MSDISLKVTSDSSQARQDLSRLTDSVNRIEQTTTKTSKTLGGLALQVTAAFAAFSGIRAITRASDAFTNLENRIALVTGRTSQLVKVQEELLQVSIRARGSIEGSVEVFNRFGLALKNAGVNTTQLLEATEAVQKAVTLSGADAISANAAIIQLGQGLASGQLRGQELNSVLEQTPRIAQAIADNLGVSLGELRKLAEQGALTTDVVFNSLLQQSGAINKEFEQLAPTFQQGLLRATTAFRRLLSEFAKATGFSAGLGRVLNFIAVRLENLANIIGPAIDLFSTRIQLLVINIKQVSDAFLNLFRSIGKQIALTLPIIRTFTTPIEVLARSTLFDQVIKNFNSFYDATIRTREGVRGVAEALGVFALFGDSQTARNVFRIFDARNIQEFTKEINNLATGLDPTNIISSYNTLGVTLTDNLIRPFAILNKELRSVGAALGLVRNPIIELSFFRIDRIYELFAQSLQSIAYLLSSVITPIIVTGLLRVSQVVLNTITIIRSLLGVGPSFFEQIRNSLLSFDLSVKLFFSNILGLDVALGTLYGTLTSFAGIRTAIFENIRLSLIILGNTVESILDKVNDVTESWVKMTRNIISRTKELTITVIRYIREFAEKVKDYFFDIYDKVVGNSYWPDTIDRIEIEAKRLINKILPIIKNFATQVLNTFKYLSTNLKDFSSSFTIKLNFDKSDLKDFLLVITETFKELSALLVGAVIVAFAQPDLYNKIREFLILGLKGTFVAALIKLVSDAFNVNAFREIGEALGTALGFYVNQFIQTIPASLQAIVDFIDGFGTKFLEQFGIIGQGLNALISLFSFGQDGLLGYILLGSLPVLLANIGIVKTAIASIQTILPPSGPGGILGQALLGPNFKYLLGSITLIFTSLSDSSNAYLALFAATPLLVTAILGEDIVGKLIKDAVLKIFAFLVSQSLLLGQKLTRFKIFEKLFGENNTSSIRRNLDNIRTYADKTFKAINDTANRESYLKGEKSFGQFLQGTDSLSAQATGRGSLTGTIETQTKSGIFIVERNVKKAIASSGEALASKQIVGSVKQILAKVQSAVIGTQAILQKSNLGKNIQDTVSGFTSQVNTVFTTVERKGGKEPAGLFGKFIFGKNIKAFAPLILGAFGLFAASANAATGAIEGETVSLFDKVLGFVGEFGFLATLFPAAGLAYVSSYFTKVTTTLAGVGKTIATIASSKAPITLFGALLGIIKGVVGAVALLGVGFTKLFALGLPGLLALLKVGFFGLAGAIKTAAIAANALFIALLRLLSNPIVILIIGALVGIGAIGIWLFGEGNSLSEKFDNLIFRFGQLFTASSKLEKQLKETLAPKNISGVETFDFSAKINVVDFNALDETSLAYRRLQSAVTAYSEVQNQAIKEEEEFGLVNTETAALLRKRAEILNNLLDSSAYESNIKGLQNSVKALNNSVLNTFIFDPESPSKTEKIISEYTRLNDVFSNSLKSTADVIDQAVTEINPFVSAEDIDSIKRAVLEYKDLTNQLTGLNRFLKIFRNEEFRTLELRALAAGEAAKQILAEADARAKAKQELVEYNNDLSSLKSLLEKEDIKVELKDLFGIEREQVRVILSQFTDQINQAKKKIEDSPTPELKAKFQAEYDLIISNIKFEVEESKLKRNLGQQIERAINLSGFSSETFSELLQRGGFNSDAVSEILSNANYGAAFINELEQKKLGAQTLAEFVQADKQLNQARLKLFDSFINNVGNKALKLREILKLVNVQVDESIISSLSNAQFAEAENLTKQLAELEKIRQFRVLNRQETRRQKLIKEDLAELFKTVESSFTEQLSQVTSRAGISLSISDLFNFTAGTDIEILKRVQNLARKVKELTRLETRDDGVPIDLIGARTLQKSIESEQNSLSDAIARVKLTLKNALENLISSTGITLDFSQLIQSSSTEEIQGFFKLNDKIAFTQKLIDEIKASTKNGALDPAAITQMQNLIALLETFKKEARDKIPETFKDIIQNIESKLGLKIDVRRLNTGNFDLLKETNNAIKKLEDEENKLKKIRFEELKKEQKERLINIQKQKEALSKSTSRALDVVTFESALNLIKSVGLELSQLEFINLDPKNLSSLIDFGIELKQLQEDILNAQLNGDELDQAKLARYQQLLTVTERIKKIDEERKRTSEAILNATKEQIKGLLTGQGGGIKSFLSSVTNTVIDGFANRLNEFLFKNVSNSLGSIFSIGLDSLFGEAGDTPANPLYVAVVNDLLKGLGSNPSSLISGGGAGNLLSTIGGSFKSFGTALSSFKLNMDAGFGFFDSLAFAFADGGVVPANSTGAMPVIAHAGEIILNEAQQARVAAAMQNGSSGQQVINLNITGDISRQTKSEIYRMLPSIAEGVNSHNREKGYRG